MISTAGATQEENGAMLVEDGNIRSAIVIPDKPVTAVEYAAHELQYHVQKATGATIPIVKESEKSTVNFPSFIYLGACRQTLERGLDPQKLAPNSFILKTIASDFFITGHDGPGKAVANSLTKMGTLMGVYEFLERQMGVKWLWPGELGEVVPATPNITVPQWDQTEKPKLLHKRWRPTGLDNPEGWASAQARDHYSNDKNIWLLRQRFVVGTPMEIHHAFVGSWKRFGQSRPEYFNLLPDGTRQSEPPDDGTHVSMCVSEPGLWKQIVADKKAKMWPQDGAWIDASENDTPGKCTCSNCMAWDEPDPDLNTPWNKRLAAATEAFLIPDSNWARFLGSLSDRYAKFYLAVQKEAEKVDPDAVVMGLAYENYWKPPLKTKLNKRVVIGLVPAVMYPWTVEKCESFRKQWEGWAATGARLLLRPNYMDEGHCFPIFIADKLGEDLAFAAQSETMVGVDFNAINGQWAVQGPNLYIVPRILDHPDWPVKKILDEYYSAFGSAKEDVKNYFEHWRNVSDAVTDEFFTRLRGNGTALYPAADKIFTPEVMKKGFSILSQAKKSAEKDDIALQRVIFLEKGLRNAHLTMLAQTAHMQYKESGELDAFRKAISELDKFRRECEAEGLNIADMAWLRAAEDWSWPRDLAKVRNRGRAIDSVWKFSWDPQKKGEEYGWWKDEVDDISWEQIPITSLWSETSLGRKWQEEHKSEYKGTSWYRSAFTLSSSPVPRRYFLIFGAVHGTCRIWVNGKSALIRAYEGPTDSFLRGPFQVEITSFIRFDKPNTVAVQADYTDGAGGIWKPVWIYDAESTISGKNNLIQDPGFEIPEIQDTSWMTSVMCGQCEFSIDRKEKFAGESSGKISCLQLDQKTNKSQARWYQNISVKKDKSYRLRVWVKTSREFNGAVAVWFRSGIGGEGSANRSACISSTDGLWQQIIIKDIVPQQDSAFIYLNLMDSTGSVWFDDVELVETDGSNCEFGS